MGKTIKSKRFEKLRVMREELCEKEKNRHSTQIQHDWLWAQVNDLKKVTECENCTIESIKTKIEQILSEMTKRRSEK